MPAPWSAGNRVKISNQNSQYRNHLGTVQRRDGDNYYVRIDGHEAADEILFVKGDLQDTTQPSPIEY